MQVSNQATVGVGLRLLALIIDTIVVGLLMCPLLIIAAIVGDADATGTSGIDLLINCITTIFSFVYYIGLEGTRGATVGKMALGLRVVKVDGSAVTLQDAVIRNLLRIVDAFPYFIPYLAGAVLIWTSPAKQRLGDRVANTLVVKKDQATIADPPYPTARF